MGLFEDLTEGVKDIYDMFSDVAAYLAQSVFTLKVM